MAKRKQKKIEWTHYTIRCACGVGVEAHVQRGTRLKPYYAVCSKCSLDGQAKVDTKKISDVIAEKHFKRTNES